MGGRKKPDFSSFNIPLIEKYCEENGLNWYWKDEVNGHLVIENADTEAYIWVQRMTVQIRKRGGYELSKYIYDRPEHGQQQFSKKRMNYLLQIGKVIHHTTKEGIKVTRRRAI